MARKLRKQLTERSKIRPKNHFELKKSTTWPITKDKVSGTIYEQMKCCGADRLFSVERSAEIGLLYFSTPSLYT
jgi:hypothetical protein